MSRKNVKSWTPINGVSMAGNITSDPTNVQHSDNIGYLVSWTGTSPVGEIFVDVSNDEASTPTTWKSLDFGSQITVSGNSGSHDININQLPFVQIRVRYVRSSGVGTLTVKMNYKQAGG